MLGFAITVLFVAAVLWAFWPFISRFLRIAANEGDEVVAGLEKARKIVKRKITR